jgi:hypothetical protein
VTPTWTDLFNFASLIVILIGLYILLWGYG